MRRILAAASAVGLVMVVVPAALARTPQVLRVGSFRGIPGQFTSVQAAVDAAQPGDWVLVGPGDYKTTSSREPSGRSDTPAAVLITKSNLYLRGMNRNAVVIDGTKPRTPRCSSSKAAQNFGPPGAQGPLGLNGVMVFKANNVWVQNLTACNFLGGTGDAGNEVWWNGGDHGYHIGGRGYLGSYLNATSTFFDSGPAGEKTAAQYGIFSSNWSGGTWVHTYASNFNDSDYYIGACQQVCDQVVDDAHGQYSALGYSGSNSGGRLVITHSEFDHNEDGFDTNSQNGDEPSPQNGACPNNATSPITHTHSCWVFMNNYVHDNNNPNVPAAGSAAAGPVGTGMSLSGGRNDTIMHNRFVHNGAWGVIIVPYLDSGPPCTGGTMNAVGPGSCLYDEWGDALLGNTFSGNGFFGHPSNGDFAQSNFEAGHPTNCYSGNREASGALASSSPSNLQQQYPTCNGRPSAANPNPSFLSEVLCDSQVQLLSGVPAVCPTGQYPRRKQIIMHPLPRGLRKMPNPCAGVPSDPWCGGQTIRVPGCAAPHVSVPLSVAQRQRVVSVRIRAAGHTFTYKPHASARSVSLGLGPARHRTIRAWVIERIKVGSHTERITFTRVYRRC
ncbi:MAG: hypothetical protein ACYC91_00670 [Solirubrobacteraceae bacterium]